MGHQTQPRLYINLWIFYLCKVKAQAPTTPNIHFAFAFPPRSKQARLLPTSESRFCATAQARASSSKLTLWLHVQFHCKKLSCTIGKMLTGQSSNIDRKKAGATPRGSLVLLVLVISDADNSQSCRWPNATFEPFRCGFAWFEMCGITRTGPSGVWRLLEQGESGMPEGWKHSAEKLHAEILALM